MKNVIRKSEVKRFLGYGRMPVDERTDVLIDECIKEVLLIEELRSVYKKYDIKLTDESVSFGSFGFESKDLCRNLEGCNEAFLFVATLGVPFDLLLKKNLKLNMPKAVVLQATGAAAIEEYCDHMCRVGLLDELKEGQYLKPRFSPGFGDFYLTNQRSLLKEVESSRKIGVSLGDGDIMFPEKSVSAVIGITTDPKYRIYKNME